MHDGNLSADCNNDMLGKMSDIYDKCTDKPTRDVGLLLFVSFSIIAIIALAAGFVIGIHCPYNVSH